MDRGLITEWRPLWEGPTALVVPYVISLAVVAYVVWRSGVRRLPGLSLVVLSAWAALRHERHVSVYAVVWLCWVPAWVQTTSLGTQLSELGGRQGRRMLVVWVVVATATLTACRRYHARALRTAPPASRSAYSSRRSPSTV